MYVGLAWVRVRVMVDGIGMDSSSLQLITLTTNTHKMYLKKYGIFQGRWNLLTWLLS